MSGRVRARVRRVGVSAVAVMALAGAVVVGLSTAASATAVTLYVGTGGTTSTCLAPGASACPTIADAITESQGGSYAGDDVTIDVAAGTYTENENFSVTSSNSLSFVGASASTTTVSGGGAGTAFCIRGHGRHLGPDDHRRHHQPGV